MISNMVSRRNFFSILVMMAVLLFMFQILEVAKENQNDYNINAYISEEQLSGKDVWVSTAENYASGNFVVFFGRENSNIGAVIKQWCTYTKKSFTVCGRLEDYTLSEDNLPQLMLIDSNYIDPVENLDALEKITDSGVTLVFCNLPDAEEIKRNRRLMKLLGIQRVRETMIETEGVHLFGNFLLGGESFYIVGDGDEKEQKRQDMELNVPWYITSNGTKTYMVATLDELLEDVEEKNELFPSLIWRNVYKDSRVFVVNGDYLESIEGIGILSGILYESSSYSIYPVVNAQNVTVANFPGLAGENDGKLVELYSRSTAGVLRDICWPTISAMAERNHYKLTCLFATQFDYADEVEPTGNEIPFYLQQFKEFNSEAGISLKRWEESDFSEKLLRDEAFFDALEDSYTYSALYVDEKDLVQLEKELEDRKLLKDVRTFASGYQEDAAVVSYYNEGVTRQNVTAEADFHSYSDNLRVRSLETALGYSNVLLDMYSVIWPESKDDQWEKVSEAVTSNLNTYWKPFTIFEKTTLSESDSRIRTFLNLDYKEVRKDDTIYLELSGVDEGWFILRTHGEKVVEIEGGTYEKIEDDSYLIQAQQVHVELKLEKSRGVLEYSED